MDVIVILHASAALLLLIAGLAKLARPAPTADLLGSLGLAVGESVARLIGLVESVVGISALVIGGALMAGATGALYLGFVVVVVRAIGEGAASCGCFGRVDAPPSWIHVVGNGAFALVSLGAVAGDTPVQVMDGQPAAGAGFVLLVGVIAGLALVTFTALPEALGARRPGSAVAQAFRIREDAP